VRINYVRTMVQLTLHSLSLSPSTPPRYAKLTETRGIPALILAGGQGTTIVFL